MIVRLTPGKLAGLFFLIAALLLPLSVTSISADGLPTNTPRPTNGKPTLAGLPTNTRAVTATQPLPTLVPSRTPQPSRTPRPSRTATYSDTPSPTRTPTFTRTPKPTLVIEGTYATPIDTPMTEIPPSMPTPVVGNDITTILLLGSDTITPNTPARTDVMILLAINRAAQSVSMLHIPRDMLVYIPNFNMGKLNTVVAFGNQNLGRGEGIKLMKETIQYNFGIKVDFYARVDFVTFQEIVTKLGGLELTVDCGLQDWKLKSPELDITLAENYEPFTLNIGKYTLDGYTALWYVRSRVTSNDLDRGRRQMEVLRAMWRQARDQGIFAQAAQLWPEAQRLIETDLTLPDILGLAPVALSVSPDRIQRITLTQGVHFKEWYTADEGRFVWLPEREPWQIALQNLMLPPARNRLGGENPTIEIGAYIGIKDLDKVAGDRLSWDGFTVSYLPMENMTRRQATVIIDYTGGSSPNSLKVLLKALRTSADAVVSKPDPNRTVDFHIELGANYGSSCFYALPESPADAATATPAQ
jgi:LCP family protein required for cell wall assembly